LNEARIEVLTGLALQHSEDMPHLIIKLKKLFSGLKPKNTSRTTYLKLYLMHNTSVKVILDTLKEEMNHVKLYIKPQPVQHWDIETLG